MSREAAVIKATATWRLVKWEGDPPPDADDVDPLGHPQVLEVIEGGDDVPTKVTYRRPEWP